jgi:biotin synthase
MEVCVTLGQIGDAEARKLKAAGVTAYNHNIDTSPEFYPEIVSTHMFSDRLNTIAAVQKNGISVCCGGIVGMGESVNDRLRMIDILSELNPLLKILQPSRMLRFFTNSDCRLKKM